MSLLLVCGAVFIGKEGRSSKSPPSVVPSRPPSPGQVARSEGLGESSPRPLSRRRDLRFPPCAFASQTPSLRIASLTLPWCQAIVLLTWCQTPPLNPRPHREEG